MRTAIPSCFVKISPVQITKKGSVDTKQIVISLTLAIHRAGLRHRPTRPYGLGPRGFRGPALSKVKEMCRYSYSLSHEKSEKMFWIVTWPISHRFRDKRRFPSKIANFSHPAPCIAPAGIGYRPIGSIKALIRPWQYSRTVTVSVAVSKSPKGQHE